MRKIVILSILVLIAMVLISCSGGGKQVSKDDGSSKPAATQATENTAAENTAEEDTTEELEEDSGAGISVSLGEIGQNLSLPDSFPKDVFPVPEDANIINVNENTDNKNIGIIFTTGKNFDESVAYCQDIMKDGSVTVEDKQENSYILVGSKNKYSIMITVTKYNGENISVLFNVTPE